MNEIEQSFKFLKLNDFYFKMTDPELCFSQIRFSGRRLMGKKLTRSENMSRIRSRDTKPEILLREALWSAGCRYRLHYHLPGRPDLVFVKPRLAVFIDGCFWHGCPQHYSAPATRQEFWSNKLRENVIRDIKVGDALDEEGWRVLRVWQHELVNLDDVVSRIRCLLNRKNPDDVYDRPIPEVLERTSCFNSTRNTEDFGDGWWHCDCGSRDVCVLSVSNPGSLRPQAKKRPESVELLCRKCRSVWTHAGSINKV